MVFKILGDVITLLFDLLLIPFKTLHPNWGLLFISLISGFWMIFIFKGVSNQEKISRIRRKMGGQVLGILLHVSSPGTVLKFAGKLIMSNFYYLWLILLPLLVIAIPFMLTYAQLEARYSTIPFAEITEPAVVTFTYADSLPVRDDILIEGHNVTILNPVVMIDTLMEVSFEIMPVPSEGTHLFLLETDSLSLPVGRIRSGNGAIISRGFESEQLLGHLLRPWIVSSEYHAGSPVAGHFTLPDIRFAIFGLYWSWLAVFLVFSSLSAIAGAIVFKIKV